MNNYGLTEQDLNIIFNIFSKYKEISEVILFGSRALNKYKLTSDIDFAIKGEKISKIIGALLTDFVESNLIYEVDIINYSQLSSENLIKHIDLYGISIYKQ